MASSFALLEDPSSEVPALVYTTSWEGSFLSPMWSPMCFLDRVCFTHGILF